MANWIFERRLRKELPTWVEKGWVRPDAQEAILEHASHPGSVRMFTYAVSVLGVLLLGTGVITFFAANWDGIAKLTKLTLLFGSLWLAYGGAAYLLAVKRMPHLGEAMLLLGVLLFGANIMLIAQIYHIDAHYPDGVLLWALGGLLTAYGLQSQTAMVSALVLATLWTLLEGYGFDGVHWWYLPFQAICLPLVVRRRWTFALHTALIGLLLWTTHVYALDDLSRSDALYLTQFYFAAFTALFVLGLVLNEFGPTKSLAAPVQRYALFASLVAFYLLTFPDFQEAGGWWHDLEMREPATPKWLVLSILALIAVIALAVWHRRLSGGAQGATYLAWGLILVGTGAGLVLANLFVTGSQGNLFAVLFNLLFFATMVWLVFAGQQAEDRFLVNIAFSFFVLALLSRYIDTFWTLLNRSFFFTVGGVILLVGGYFLERQRRRLSQQIVRARQEISH